MALLKFRVFPEEEEAVYRDVIIRHAQSFEDLHNIILEAYHFDKKHQATFYRSNESWEKGREISLEKYDKAYRAQPLIMRDTKIAGEIFNTNQKFIYEYDFAKSWVFYVSLIAVIKEEDPAKNYPLISRTEGAGPQQYKQNTGLGKQFMQVEEKYDLARDAEGFGTENENGEEEPGAGEEDSF